MEVGLQVVNGWNRVLDGNGRKTIAVTADYKSPKLSWYNDYYIGPEHVDGANLRRTLFDTTLVASPFHHLSVDINLDDGSQARLTQRTSEWIGVAVSAQLRLPYQFIASPRWEWFNDRDGFTTGTPQTVHEFTLTGERPCRKEWSPASNIATTRPTASSSMLVPNLQVPGNNPRFSLVSSATSVHWVAKATCSSGVLCQVGVRCTLPLLNTNGLIDGVFIRTAWLRPLRCVPESVRFGTVQAFR